MTERLLDPKNWKNPKTGQRYRYFSRDGVGYEDVLDWAREFEPPRDKDAHKKWFNEVKVVKQEYTPLHSFWVSTVWLGMDHSWDENEPPLIFESMVFCRWKLPKVGKYISHHVERVKTKIKRIQKIEFFKENKVILLTMRPQTGIEKIMDNPLMRPDLFETCSDLDMDRYTTETEALEGHKKMVEKWSHLSLIFWHLFDHEGIDDWLNDLKWKYQNWRDQ